MCFISYNYANITSLSELAKYLHGVPENMLQFQYSCTVATFLTRLMKVYVERGA